MTSLAGDAGRIAIFFLLLKSTDAAIHVLTYAYMRAHTAMYVCPHTAVNVSSHCWVCVPSYCCVCVLILLGMCALTLLGMCVLILLGMCALILLCMCALILLYICPPTALYVSSVFVYVSSVFLSAIYVSSYCYICVLTLLCTDACMDSDNFVFFGVLCFSQRVCECYIYSVLMLLLYVCSMSL